jgi:hypothetical protein
MFRNIRTALGRLGEFYECKQHGKLTTPDAKRNQSPEYQKALNPDAIHFMAMPIKVMVGYENLVFGKTIRDMPGQDGILFDTESHTPDLEVPSKQ